MESKARASMWLSPWKHGEIVTVGKMNAQVSGINEALAAASDAVRRLELAQQREVEKPSGAAAVLAGGLALAGSSAVVSRRNLLGLGWLRRK